jgi:hypothetical protein
MTNDSDIGLNLPTYFLQISLSERARSLAGIHFIFHFFAHIIITNKSNIVK